MNLLFDLTASQPISATKRHGGGKYCEMLFFAMCQRNLRFQAFFNSTNYINPKIFQASKSAGVKLYDIKDRQLNDIVKEKKISHIYSALPERILPWPACKVLGTIHGLRSFEIPFDFFSLRQYDKGFIGLNTLLAQIKNKKNKVDIKNYYQKLLNREDFKFVTVSNHSQKIIHSICPNIDTPVFYPPSTSVSQSKKTSNEKFFFMVSGDRVEKNCTRAIIAIDELLTKKQIPPNISIKITGTTHNISRYSIKNMSNFKFLGYVDEKELDFLYANAYAFIYPSLNEGFGYPPLEAMKYNVPVIASNAASIPEVCGNAALYFNPTSIRELEERIIELQEERVYFDLQKKGTIRFHEIEARQKEDLDKLVDWIIRNSI